MIKAVFSPSLVTILTGPIGRAKGIATTLVAVATNATTLVAVATNATTLVTLATNAVTLVTLASNAVTLVTLSTSCAISLSLALIELSVVPVVADYTASTVLLTMITERSTIIGPELIAFSEVWAQAILISLLIESMSVIVFRILIVII